MLGWKRQTKKPLIVSLHDHAKVGRISLGGTLDKRDVTEFRRQYCRPLKSSGAPLF